MSSLVHHLHKVAAGLAFVSLTTAKIIMVIIINKLDYLSAEFTRPWLLGALFCMVPILILFSSKCTVFTGNNCMFFFIMLLFLCFRHTGTTLLALVVLPCAANIVHSKFAHLYVFVTEATPFGFDWFFH